MDNHLDESTANEESIAILLNHWKNPEHARIRKSQT